MAIGAASVHRVNGLHSSRFPVLTKTISGGRPIDLRNHTHFPSYRSPHATSYSHYVTQETVQCTEPCQISLSLVRLQQQKSAGAAQSSVRALRDCEDESHPAANNAVRIAKISEQARRVATKPEKQVKALEALLVTCSRDKLGAFVQLSDLLCWCGRSPTMSY